MASTDHVISEYIVFEPIYYLFPLYGFYICKIVNVLQCPSKYLQGLLSTFKYLKYIA